MNTKIYFRKLLSLVGLSLLLFACSDQSEEVQPSATIAQNAVTVTEITFTATALINECYGEDIRFTGIIENKVKKTNSASGQTHYIRQFTVKGMTAVGLETGTEFDVVGGAEMFSIKNPVYNADGSLNLSGSILGESDVVIHRGTLVFVSQEDGSHVIARHIITKNPGQGVKSNIWDCGGN
ncbi:hypothetical protein H8S95_09485 [Pontibacter sp. KCTC 32443]|uniref:hypothetical protein n=1 Tax=Pontibacter TaxID=323449 RepID=UPI00164D871D|nr:MULTISPECIES: hypothetical protein [Pontibacter]MBC5774291.1 hypothetical protein [Pontibacter sp. KCTC 32443]